MAKRNRKERVVSVRLTETQFETISKLAKDDGRTISNVVQIAIEAFLIRSSKNPTMEARMNHVRSGK